MTLRLGLLSTANINLKLLGGARAAEGVEVVAVASREAQRAEAFAAEHGLGRAHGSYEALLADPDVDAVYVPLPNSLHVPWSIRALEAGKHVLCEKPMTRRPEEAQAAFDAADRAGRVLAEGFMWRHHEQARRLRELVRDRVVGNVRLVRAAFSFFALDRVGDLRLQKALDGGGLMDVGCYCVSAMRLLAGEPERVSARQVIGVDGVDVRFAGSLSFAGGVLGSFDCGLDMVDRAELEVIGDAGSLFLPDPWHSREPRIEVRRPGGTEVIEIPHKDPYACELDDFAAAVRGERPHPFGREDAVGQARTIAALYRSAEFGAEAVP
ncbi:MAG TPA: Gfo/Idh/MocA family oxidoreductase [Solirubrobacteraceae bacterium]|nr:Gfo/Idh/MocA family oxidoreductase [Solirubrobacteraceae bacterium]